MTHFYPEITPRRSARTAYVLLFAGGLFGLHRHYLGYTAHGSIQMLLFALSLGLIGVGGVLPSLLMMLTLSVLMFWLAGDLLWIKDRCESEYH